jgi:hypothetical protein
LKESRTGPGAGVCAAVDEAKDKNMKVMIETAKEYGTQGLSR